MQVTIELNEEAELAIKRFTERQADCHQAGHSTKTDWENARSDAVDAILSILYANQDRFDYAPRMRAISQARNSNV